MENAEVQVTEEQGEQGKTRTLAVLDTLSPNKMTEAEKNAYIKALRNARAQKEAAYSALENNAKSAYEQCRTITEENGRLAARLRNYKAQVELIMRSAYASVLAFGGTVKE